MFPDFIKGKVRSMTPLESRAGITPARRIAIQLILSLLPLMINRVFVFSLEMRNGLLEHPELPLNFLSIAFPVICPPFDE